MAYLGDLGDLSNLWSGSSVGSGSGAVTGYQIIPQMDAARCRDQGGTPVNCQKVGYYNTMVCDCSLPLRAPAPAQSAPGNITVSPQIQTQVSPQISPVFQQQYQPTNSPATAGSSQETGTAPAPSGGITRAELEAALANYRAPVGVTAASVPAPSYLPAPVPMTVSAPVAYTPAPDYAPPATVPGVDIVTAPEPVPVAQPEKTVDNTPLYLIGAGLIGLALFSRGKRNAH